MSSNILQPVSMDFNVFTRENPSVYFNTTVPSIPGGNTAVTFQFDQFGNVSAYVPTAGSGSSVGTAGQLQMVGSTTGSFAASHITDNGTTVSSSLPIASSSFSVLANGGTNGSLDFGANFGAPAIIIYDGGASSQFGIGLNIGEMQSFITGSSHFSWNYGGGLQSSGTNELMRLDASANTLSVKTSVVAFTAITTATSATAGAASVLPATPLGYVEFTINGTIVKLPYYSV